MGDLAVTGRTPVARPTRDVLVAYYLATPIFALIDYLGHAPIRVSGLEDPTHRAAYYVGLLLLAGLAKARPGSAPWVGMIESAVNVLLLVLAVMLPIWGMPDAILEGGPIEGPFDRVSVLNFLLSGGALVVSFHRNQAAALGGNRRLL